MKQKGVQAIFHYLSLEQSPFITEKDTDITPLPESTRYMDCLVRLPLYNEMTDEEVNYVLQCIEAFKPS